jgi:hypothetical protein
MRRDEEGWGGMRRDGEEDQKNTFSIKVSVFCMAERKASSLTPVLSPVSKKVQTSTNPMTPMSETLGEKNQHVTQKDSEKKYRKVQTSTIP